MTIAEEHADRVDRITNDPERIEKRKRLAGGVTVSVSGIRGTIADEGGKRYRADHVERGLLYVIVWMTVAPMALGALGGWAFGWPGLVVGFIGAIALGMWGYGAYLDWHLRKARLVAGGAK